MTAPFRLAFMGTPEFAARVLDRLHHAAFDVAAVYTQAPKPAGRGHRLQTSAVQDWAEQHNLPVRTPRTLRDPLEQNYLKDLQLDLIVVVAYGLILPQAVLDLPKLGAINIHFSLLPRWRGAAPVQRALLAGDVETGVDIMRMEAGLDTGPILARTRLAITSEHTAPALLQHLADRGAEMTLEVIDGLRSGVIRSVPQTEDGATYASKLNREDGRINWHQEAAVTERQWRALQPWPGVFFTHGEEVVKVLEMQIVPGQSGEPGQLLDARELIVACQKDALKLTLIQRPGKGPTPGSAFIHGARLKPGQAL